MPCVRFALVYLGRRTIMFLASLLGWLNCPYQTLRMYTMEQLHFHPEGPNTLTFTVVSFNLKTSCVKCHFWTRQVNVKARPAGPRPAEDAWGVLGARIPIVFEESTEVTGKSTCNNWNRPNQSDWLIIWFSIIYINHALDILYTVETWCKLYWNLLTHD